MNDEIEQHLARFAPGTIVTIVRADGTRRRVRIKRDAPEQIPPGDVPDVPIVAPRAGAGTELAALLKRIGITPTNACKCRAYARDMDRRGPDWCASNEDTILGWLRAEAESRRLPFIEFLARLLVRRAVKRARTATGN